TRAHVRTAPVQGAYLRRRWLPPQRKLLQLVHASAIDRPLRAPVLVQDRPERLGEILVMAENRLAQAPCLPRADLPQRSVAAAVQDRRTRLEPVRSNRVE